MKEKKIRDEMQAVHTAFHKCKMKAAASVLMTCNGSDCKRQIASHPPQAIQVSVVVEEGGLSEQV